MATLAARTLLVIEFTSSGAFVSEIQALHSTYGRLRTPMIGPDKALYLTTSNSRSTNPSVDKILKVLPALAVSGSTTPEYTEGDTGPVATYTAEDLAGGGLTWAVSGTDEEAFTIGRTTGVLRFRQSPDYEAKDRYEVTVEATDTHEIMGTLGVTVTGQDAPGRVRLSANQPQAGKALTATLRDDPDNVGMVTGWRWERSIHADFPVGATAEIRQTFTDSDTATYTPVADDIRHYLRATVFYADGQDTNKEVTAGTTHKVSRAGSSGGSGSGGGGGGRGRDLHGNTPARATRVRLGSTAPWASSTVGQINTGDDIDYFQFTLPQAGVLVVETTGSTDTVGTIWQAGKELANADSGGAQRNFRLNTRVAAGTRSGRGGEWQSDREL